MSNIAKLKKKAAEFEQKKQYDKALELYQQVLDFSRASDEERDVPLYNRVGDLHFRLGNSEEAISYYEKAVDLYAEGGFFNNAIALCNKILRYSPNRSNAYYKLGLISAKKGFNSDAKQNFLEYADRMHKVGKVDEAFRALKEFADLCPGQDDVRLMLAEQLARADRKPEALEQLQLLYDTLEAEGRSTEAAAAVERMKAIDPGFTPKKSITPRQRKKDSLVFLDLGYDDDFPAEPATKSDETSESAAPAGLETTSMVADDGSSARAEKSLQFIEPSPPKAEDAGSIEVAPLELAPLVDAPASEPEAASAPDVPEVAMEAPSEDAVVPVLNETALNDPLAGLDVISIPASEPEVEAVSAEMPRRDSGEFVDLAQWLEQTRTPQSTRMVAHDEEPEDNQQKDFEEMLDKFKAGVARSVDDADFDSHYDLGIAFREMGLIDEAISAFQKATRGSGFRVRASEALGECFLEKGQPGVAATILDRVVTEKNLDDDSLVGVFYLLGRTAEELDKPDDAANYYQRVIAVNMSFRDAARRLALLSKAAK
ncbi:MAG: tetratricopeptide repeat protein [Gemmatimonadaceae bacterium]